MSLWSRVQRSAAAAVAGARAARVWSRHCSAVAAANLAESVESPAAGELAYFSAEDRPHVPLLDWHRLLDTASAEAVSSQIAARKGVGDIRRLHALYRQYQLCSAVEQLSTPAAAAADHREQRRQLLRQMIYEARRIPNATRPSAGAGDDSSLRPLRVIGSAPHFDFPVKDFNRRASRLGLLRLDGLGYLTGNRTYYFMQELAQLEAALLRYALSRLQQLGFHLVSVPDIVEQSVLEGCGLHVHGERTKAYSLLNPHTSRGDGVLPTESLFMSGTAEMALAALLSGRSLNIGERQQLRLAAVSRCYRPEMSFKSSESGVYRVHQFNKVEMFGVCGNSLQQSEALLDQFVDIQQQLFASLGLHAIVYDMPPHDLGAPAYRKVDIEAWMPGRGCYGEVSSASNCTDYQSRRLHITSCSASTTSSASCPVGTVQHVHTVNGTACAAPRALIALLETHQCRDGSIRVPQPLRRFMNGRAVIGTPDDHQNNSEQQQQQQKQQQQRRAIKRRPVLNYTVHLAESQCDDVTSGVSDDVTSTTS